MFSGSFEKLLFVRNPYVLSRKIVQQLLTH
uniref:Uncharacterized protein n=1 Tax=Anguilla anguilla TaxID=7936 RepID=A0A0E9PW97_ANGAN